MCGICGIFNYSRDAVVDAEEIRRMNDAIVHRGPDEDGFYLQGPIGMGMRRLSIIDLAGGKQPISNEDGTIWIVYNGEVYNFPELRRDLEARGHRFKTKTDTEAIIHAYEEYGHECPTKLNGMFALAIWDERKKELFLTRDRIGKKPLYYYPGHDRLVFGSELKSVLQARDIPRRVSTEALDLFLTYEYVPAPHSIFADIKKLPQGHSLTVTQDGKITLRRYWDLEFRENGYHPVKLQEELLEILQDAVRIRLISDVPLGAFLSGGIDSSCMVGLMSRVMDQPVKTFSIGFEEGSYNELHYAREIARHFNTDHREMIINPDALELTEKLVSHLDEPLGDFSIFPTYLVSKMAREHVTVALSGDGGDELFGGYDTYIANWMYRKYRMMPRYLREHVMLPMSRALPPTQKKKGVINRFKRFVEGTQHPEDLQHVRWMIFLAEQEKAQLYSQSMLRVDTRAAAYDFMRGHFQRATSSDFLNRQLYVDIKTYLCDNIMVKVDRMSMATSLEARAPFLDYRVVELAAKMPGELKLHGTQTKYILKQAISELLPSTIIGRGKEGFSIPIKNWLRHELRDMLTDVLAPERIRRQGFFNPAHVNRLVNEHLKGVENHSHRLWALMVFGVWHENYMANS